MNFLCIVPGFCRYNQYDDMLINDSTNTQNEDASLQEMPEQTSDVSEQASNVCTHAKKVLEKYEDKHGAPISIENCRERIGVVDLLCLDNQYKLPSEVWMEIFKNSEIKELGIMSSVSKAFNIKTMDDTIWKPICLKTNPQIQNPNKLAWKDICEELRLKKFDGSSAWFSGQSKTYYADVNLMHDELTCKDLKRLIIKKEGLKCFPDDFVIIFAGNEITSDRLIKPYNFAKETGCFIVFKNKK